MTSCIVGSVSIKCEKIFPVYIIMSKLGKLSLNFFLSYNYSSVLSYIFIAFSFLSRRSNVMVKSVTEVTQRLDVDVDSDSLMKMGAFIMRKSLALEVFCETKAKYIPI